MIWILTESYNLYDQHGDYFIAAWLSKPTPGHLKKSIGCSGEEAAHILSGGGRIGAQESWYNFFEYEEQQ